MHPGVYIQVPFCQSKCTYCHFATGVFPPELMSAYVDAVAHEIRIHAEEGLLRQRFGPEFEDYRRRVPAYLPFVR